MVLSLPMVLHKVSVIKGFSVELLHIGDQECVKSLEWVINSV